VAHVQARLAFNEPWLVQAALRGSHLDVELLRRIHSQPGAVPAGEYPRGAGKVDRRYLDLLKRSTLHAYWVALTRPDVRNPGKDAAHDFPVLPLEVLSQAQREAVQTFALIRDQKAVDQLVAKLYGLTKADATLISDTFPDVKEMKLLGPTSAGPVIWRFAGWLEELLRPVFARTGNTVRCSPLDAQPFDGWQVLELRTAELRHPEISATRAFPAIAERWSSTFVVQRLDRGRLAVALRSEIRCASLSTARLVALHILHEHAGHLRLNHETEALS
jgi:hypothetical protein